MDVYLISRVPKAHRETFSERVESVGSDFLGPQYSLEVREVVSGHSLDTVIAIARNRHNPMPELFFGDDSLFYVFSGYVVDDLQQSGPRDFFRARYSDQRPITRSPGGIYSYATIRRSDGQVCAGHSIPTLEPVYFSHNESCMHVGNHPLLVHVADRGFDRPAVDEHFYFSAVNGGVAIDDTTPFLGCYRIPPRSVLVNQPNSEVVRIRPAPRPDFGRYRHSTFRQRRESLTDALLQAGAILKRLPQGEFRVSGGKDSRLVAAFLKHERIEVTPVNQNLSAEVEGQVADLVSQDLGYGASVRSSSSGMFSFEAQESGTRRKVAFAGGLPAVASLYYPTPSEGGVPGVPLIMGHAHLQRGGFGQRIRTNGDAYATAASRTVSPYIWDAYSEPNSRIVRRFVNETLARGVFAQSVGFHAYVQYTMNYQFQSLYAYVRNWNPLITPLVDERFALLCEEIADSTAPLWHRRREHAGITDLRNESLAMGVTEALSPSLLEFPLANDRYRWDLPSSRNHRLRDPSLIESKPIGRNELAKIFNPRRLSTEIRSKMWERIESSSVASLAQITIRPEIWRYVSEPNSSVPADQDLTLLNQFVWSLYGLSMILGSEWWDVLDSTSDE